MQMWYKKYIDINLCTPGSSDFLGGYCCDNIQELPKRIPTNTYVTQ